MPALQPKTFLIALLAFGLTHIAQGQTPQNEFHRGYYLERAERDHAGAAEAYASVLSDRKANNALKSQARVRLAAVREDIAATDFARLMPPTSLAYIEIKRPDDQILKLLQQLGLLADDEPRTDNEDPQVRVSPALIKEIFGIGGAAVAITGFDPAKGKPIGVAVFHPGNLELVRGLIETGLPIGGTLVEPIGGFPTYDVEGEALITLTARLVIASPQRSQIQGVVDRLTGKKKDSLATEPSLTDSLADRDDALLFFCINAKPLIPLVEAITAAQANNPQVAMVKALLDPSSLRSLSGRIGVSDNGLSLNVALRLEEGHHNLIYNILRMPPIGHQTLARIPQGAAAFAAAGLNPSGSRFSTSTGNDADRAIVTAMDFGRELFANITTIAMFVLPPGENAPAGAPIPDVGAVITVNDPARSEALWTQLLGIASLAAGTGAIEGDRQKINGVDVRSFKFPDRVTVHVAFDGNDMVIGTTTATVARALDAKRSGKSILDDPAYARHIDLVTGDTTKALFIHPGRCAKTARQFMSPDEVKEIEPFAAVLQNTVVSLVINHSNGELRLAVDVTGIPNIGPMLSQLIAKEKARGRLDGELAGAMRRKNWDRAEEIIDSLLASDPGNTRLLTKKFRLCAVGRLDHNAAVQAAKAFQEAAAHDAKSLNNFAWSLLTDDEYASAYHALALEISRRSNELSNHQSWVFLDTLALAEFENGDANAAVRLQKKTIELANGKSEKELSKRLARFEAATNTKVAVKTSPASK